MGGPQMKSMISRRTFLRFGAGVASIAALAGCMPPAAPASTSATGAEAPDGSAVELEIWTGWTEDAATNIEKILTGYNESQERVVAKHVVVPEAMTQKLLA